MEHRNDDERVRYAATLEEEGQDQRPMDDGSTSEGRTDAPDEQSAVPPDEQSAVPPDEQGAVPEDRDVAAATSDRAALQTAPSNGARRFQMYTGSDMDAYRRRWDELQAGFVDDPRAATDQADMLIGELVDRVSQRRRQLHDEFGGRAGGDTESMRLAIQEYRAFFRTLVHEPVSPPQRG